jgi:hypothetical protein
MPTRRPGARSPGLAIALAAAGALAPAAPAAERFVSPSGDDGDSGDAIEGNVMLAVDAAVFIGGGHDNLITGNVAVDCRKAVHADARGVSRGYNRGNARMVGILESVNYRQPPWSARYPSLAGILEFHPELPTGNVIDRTLGVRCGKLLDLAGKKEELQFMKMGTNLAMDRDPGFADAAALDFRIRPDAPALTPLPGFQAIPFDKIGLVVDEDRRALPTAQELDRSALPTVDARNDVDPLAR